MRRWLLSDYKTKLLALFLGVLLWFYAKGEVVLTEDVTARLSIQAPSADVIARAEGRIETTTLKVEGRKSDVERLQPADLSVVVRPQIPETALDVHYDLVALSEKDVRGIVGNVNILSFEPSEISVRLERKAEESKLVEARIEGSPAPGYEIGSAYVNPPRVLVEGPRTLLAKTDKVKTVPIYVSERPESFWGEFAIDPQVEGGEVSCKRKVYVYVSIRPATIVDTIEGVPVHISYRADYRYHVNLHETETGKVSVELRGTKEKLEELKKNAGKGILAFVDVTTLAPVGDLPQSQEVRFVLPQGVSLVEEGEKSKVEVMIRERPAEDEGA